MYKNPTPPASQAMHFETQTTIHPDGRVRTTFHALSTEDAFAAFRQGKKRMFGEYIISAQGIDFQPFCQVVEDE